MTDSHFRTRRPLLPLLCLAAGLLMGSHIPLQAQTGKKGAKATPTPKPSASPTAATSDELPNPVATVDGENITKDDLTKVAAALLNANGRSIAELNAADKKRMYQSVLDEMIADRLISKASAGQAIDEMDLEKQYGQIRQQYPTQEAFEEAMKKAGQTADGVKANIRTQLKQAAWISSKIADEIKVEPLEADKFYKESPPAKFDAPEMVRASHILIGLRKDATPEAVMAAQDKIKAASDRLAKGEAFDKVAKDVSEDPSAKQTGGDLDYFSHERIMPEFADAAFKLKIGEVSAPVRTQFGIHLIKLTDRKAAHTATLEEAREQIIAYLQSEKRKVAVAKLVQTLKDNAKIVNKLQ